MKTVPLGQIHAVLRGQAVPCARPDGSPGGHSAIAKRPVAGPVRVGAEGLEGDEQGDRRVHGGPDKAVHQYALEHYAAWRADLGALPVLDAPGAFGENLVVSGIDFKSLPIGTRFSCNDGDEVEMRFFNLQGVGVLVRHGETIELKQEPAASGFKYSNGPTTVRGKGDALTLEIGRMVPIECQALSK